MDKYYIGLDVGTNSIGWAATNEEYDLLRLKGKHAWGSRIFSEASDKKGRRGFRSSRRRVARRKYRIQLLNEIFAENINKIDNTFFARLDNASYLFEDKKNKGLSKNLVFKTFEEEKKFYEKYPTTWHLRKALINKEENALSDLRNVYMAMHHIIKYRGNFLRDGSFNISEFDSKLLDTLNAYFKDKYINSNEEEVESDFITSASSSRLIEILLDNNAKKVNKQKDIKKLFNCVAFEEYINMFASIVTGGTYKLSKIEKSLEQSIDFNKASFEENIAAIQQELGDDFVIVQIAKEIFDYITLNKLIGNHTYLSDVMIEVYDDHKTELSQLKQILIDIDNNKGFESEKDRTYHKMFKDKKSKENYPAYIHVGSENTRAELEVFNKYVEKVLLENKEYISEDNKSIFENLLTKSQNRELLRTIALASTSLIPHQLHLIELEQIIENCKNIYPFIYENKDKLISLFKFRVPYYFGPLNSRSEYSNVVRHSNETITPWNINNIVDDNKTREKFMKRLTNTCSYLLMEKVMPKVSLAFEEYVILDRLNVMLVNGLPLSSKEKEEVLNYLLTRSKTTINQLKTRLSVIKNTPVNDILISKINVDVPFEATSHAHLMKKFDLSNREVMEYFIFLATVYADDKKSFKEMLSSSYPELKDDEIKHLLTLPTKKWAPISYKLLNGIYYTDDAGVLHSILDIMKDTNENFQMVLNNSQYNFLNQISELNKQFSGDKSIDEQVNTILEEVPSITRRSIHQTLLIIDDVIKAAKGNEPSKIFIEVTRNDDDKKKGNTTNPRVKEVEIFLKALEKDIKNIPSNVDINLLSKEYETIDKAKVKGKHVYLYFKQMGIDVYTGKPIYLNDVLNSSKYDLDHIVPQSLIKDDSLDNLVLVDREYNQKVKKDYYPIPLTIRNSSNIKLWKYLKEIKAISEKKYNNLVRSSEISLAEIEDFVARQINVIDYSNITIRNILNIKYPNTKVVFSKSQYPHYIREKLNIVKNRAVNDTHHAVDAYLNVIAGNILSTEFSDVRKIYAKKQEANESKTFNMTNTLDRYLRAKKEDVALKDKVIRNCFRRDILVTFKNDYQFGPLYKQTINKKGESTALIPIHTNEDNPMHDTSKYGGYLNLTQSYMMAVTYKEKGKEKKAILRVPNMFDKVYSNNQDELLRRVVGDNVQDIKIITKIYQNQKIRYQGCEYLIYTSNENCNKYKMAHQNYIDNDILSYLNFANKHLSELDVKEDIVEIVKNKKNDKILISKSINLDIFKTLVMISFNPVYDSCNYIVKARNTQEDVFIELNLKDQIETLTNFVSMYSRDCEAVKFNPVLENMSKNMKLLLSNNVTGQDICIIYESPTGLFSHEVKI